MNDTGPPLAKKSGDDPYGDVSLRDLSMREISWAVLILLTLYVCYFSHLGAFGFIGPDEPRYAWIARDMAESGDWVTPRLYGKPWFEKPVLYYWAAGVCFKLFGVNEANARLPSAVCALLATLSLAWLAVRIGGWNAARWVLLLLPSTVGMIGFSHAASTDMPFSAMLSIAMVCAAVVLGLVPANYLEEPVFRQTKKAIYLSLALFGFFLGLAVLAKGPAALILAGGAMLLWAASTRRWHDALRLFHPIGVGTFFLTCLPWYVLCARRNPEFFRVFIIEHNFRRYLTPEFQHIQPFWYYLPITILALLPWVFWLAWFITGDGRKERGQHRAQILLLAGWGVYPVLFFSLSKSKLPGYILPAVLPLGFLISLAVRRTLKSTHVFGCYVLGLIGALLLASPGWIFFSKVHVRGPLVSLYIIVATVGGLIVIGAALLRQTRAGLTFSVVLVLFLLNLVYVSLSKLDPQLSARSCARQIGVERAANTYSFKLQRSWQYQLSFYLHREIAEWSPNVAVEATVVTSERSLEELERSAQIVAVISKQSPQAEVVVVRPLLTNPLL
ncbi:MAG TPA: glycosyltransferase family 39 protein [Candidatus Acidoferrum sp.]|nr:glycosyltransferase family 39 protein [Candidatus Acidoferrum sp.]